MAKLYSMNVTANLRNDRKHNVSPLSNKLLQCCINTQLVYEHVSSKNRLRSCY